MLPSVRPRVAINVTFNLTGTGNTTIEMQRLFRRWIATGLPIRDDTVHALQPTCGEGKINLHADAAHTGDSEDQVLRSIRRRTSHRVVCVMCGSPAAI